MSHVRKKTFVGLPLPAPGSGPRPKHPVLFESKYSLVGEAVPVEKPIQPAERKRRK